MPTSGTDRSSIVGPVGIVCGIRYYCMPSVIVAIRIGITRAVGIGSPIESIVIVLAWEAVA